MNTAQTIQALKEEVTKIKSRLTSLESINEELLIESKSTTYELNTTTETAYQALDKTEGLEEAVQRLNSEVSRIKIMHDYCKMFYSDLKDVIAGVACSKRRAIERIAVALQKEPSIQDKLSAQTRSRRKK